MTQIERIGTDQICVDLSFPLSLWSICISRAKKSSTAAETGVVTRSS